MSLHSWDSICLGRDKHLELREIVCMCLSTCATALWMCVSFCKYVSVPETTTTVYMPDSKQVQPSLQCLGVGPVAGDGNRCLSFTIRDLLLGLLRLFGLRMPGKGERSLLNYSEGALVSELLSELQLCHLNVYL